MIHGSEDVFPFLSSSGQFLFIFGLEENEKAKNLTRVQRSVVKDRTVGFSALVFIGPAFSPIPLVVERYGSMDRNASGNRV